MSDEGIHLATITITLTMDDDGDEVINLDHTDDLGVAYMLGILDLCRDTILHPPEDDD